LNVVAKQGDAKRRPYPAGSAFRGFGSERRIMYPAFASDRLTLKSRRTVTKPDPYVLFKAELDHELTVFGFPQDRSQP
jgi:hypothetical protein